MSSLAYQFSDAGRAEAAQVRETGNALAEAAFERGQRLTDDERAALRHWSMFGSDGYPVHKAGRKWSIDHPAARSMPLYDTKRAAVAAWEILIAKWVRMNGLEAYKAATC